MLAMEISHESPDVVQRYVPGGDLFHSVLQGDDAMRVRMSP